MGVVVDCADSAGVGSGANDGFSTSFPISLLKSDLTCSGVPGGPDFTGGNNGE